MNRVLHVVNAGLSCLLVGGSLWVFPTLPEQIPRHFGLAGTADAFWEASLVHWMFLPGVALGLLGFLYAVAGVIKWAPSAISVPNREQYDALDPSDQRRIVGVIQSYMYWTAFGLLLLFSALQLGTHEVAIGSSNTLPPAVLGVLVVVVIDIIGGAVWLGWHLPRRVQELSETP